MVGKAAATDRNSCAQELERKQYQLVMTLGSGDGDGGMNQQ